jgi:thiosulfate/3-mercaptopyruvate sulfurtransferase
MKGITKTMMALGLLFGVGTVQALQVTGPLIATDWLASHRVDVVILDVRRDTESFTTAPKFRRDEKNGQQRLVATGGHIPGAALVDYSHVRAGREINGQLVMNQLPTRADFEKLMQQAGVNRDSAIVIVSRGQDIIDLTMATRLYWTLKYYGHDNMGILDGGMAQWLADGRKFTIRAEQPAAGNWRAGEERRGILATTDEVIAATKTGTSRLVDNRAISLYMGTWKTSSVYGKGHIPGAGLFPGELMNSAGMPSRFLPVEELRQLFRAMDIDMDADTITYCDSGHLASGGWFLMSEVLGNRNVRLYDGSMHEWTLNRLPVRRFEME